MVVVVVVLLVDCGATKPKPAGGSSCSPPSDDRPGGLAELLSVFGAAGANLIAVEHLREGVNLHVRETEVHCTFEVRGPDHSSAIITAAREAGYRNLRVDSPTGTGRPLT
jgi:ACT domain-containing protein